MMGGLMITNPILKNLKDNKMDLKGICALDIESTGLDRYRDEITSVQLGYDTTEGGVCYEFLAWEDFTLEVWTEFFEFLRKRNVKLLLHNGKFDLLFIYVKTGVLLDIFADTLVMAHVLGDRGYIINKKGKKEDTGHTLKGLVFKHYKDYYDVETEVKKGAITEELITYGIKDVEYPRKLYRKYKQQLKTHNLVLTYKHELRAYRAYLRVETKGVYVDPDKDETREFIRSQYLPLQEKLEETAKINWGSSQQVASVLFSSFDTAIKGKAIKTTEWFIRGGKVKANGSLATSVFKTKGEAQKYVKSKGFVMSHFTYEKVVTTNEPILGFGLGLEPVKLTDKGAPSVDDDTLTKLLGKHEIIEVFREWKEWSKLETFIDSWEKIMTDDGYIHPSFNILARTGRTTCSNPNLNFVVGSFTVMCQNKQRELMEAL